jgi:hypothetical protein
MVQQRRHHVRVGLASAVAVGAWALMTWSSPAAQASAPTPCPVGTDLTGVVDTVKCPLDNLREGLTPTRAAPDVPDAPDVSPKPAPSSGTSSRDSSDTSSENSSGNSPGTSSGNSSGTSQQKSSPARGSSGGAAAPERVGPLRPPELLMPDPPPYTAANTPQRPGLPPNPQIAGPPLVETPTRLRTSADDDSTGLRQMLLAAAVSSAATVAILHRAVLLRRLQRRDYRA